MKILGVLLDDFTFTKNNNPDSLIEYIVENELNLPKQTIAGKNCNKIPYFGITPTFTKDTNEFNNINEAKEFIVKTVKPYVEESKEEIRKNISIYEIE